MKLGRGAALGLSTALGLLACNAILGNESEYHLVPDAAAGSTGADSGGDDGRGGEGQSGAGEANTGGAGNASSTGGAGAGNEAGTPSDAGAAGSGSTEPCTATGPEDCFNGRDDDCNGETDCADSACSGPASCVPGTSAAELGYFAAAAQNCAAGYTALVLHRGLNAPFECTGCSCTPQSSHCDAGIYGHQPGNCDFQFMGLLYNVFSDSCQPVLPNTTSVHYYSTRGVASCTPAGTGTPDAISWDATQTFCSLEKLGGGCPSKMVCVPSSVAASPPDCTRSTGQAQCSGDYPTDSGGAWYTGADDPRTCQCSCGNGFGACNGGYIQIFSGDGCTGTAQSLDNGGEGNDCALPFVPRSGRITNGTSAVTACPAQGSAIGDVTGQNPSTICCQ